jgi:hypothetical protein
LDDVSKQVLDFAVLFRAPKTAVGVVALRSKRNWDIIFACKYGSVLIAIRGSKRQGHAVCCWMNRTLRKICKAKIS